jgi:regulator of extracellular matrix RemA (YlzA/DUF370 family)
MSSSTFNIGHNSFIVVDKVIAIIESGSLPMKRLRETAAQKGLLIDATSGRKMRSLILLESNHVVLSALAPHTIQERLEEVVQEKHPNLSQIEMEQGQFAS